MNTTTLARAACCGRRCKSPGNCTVDDTSCAHMVDLTTAGRNLAEALPHLLCDAWRAERGPMSRTKRVGDEG